MKDRWAFSGPDHGDNLCSECGGCTLPGCKSHERCDEKGQHTVGGDN